MPDLYNSKKSVFGFLSKKPFIFAFLAFVVYVAHFLYSSKFGFYEDDFTLFVHQMYGDISQIKTSFRNIMAAPLVALGFDAVVGGHGRPFSPFFYQTLGIIGSHIAGLWGLYLVAWAIEALNAILVFLILSRRNSTVFAFMGALIYGLLPAITVRPLLTSVYEIETSGTFLALATLSYCLGIRVLPYLLITVSLWDYEFFFLPFLAAPLLLDLKWDRALFKKLAVHSIIVAFIMGFTVLMRSKAGEGRISEMFGYIYEIPLRVIQAVYTGAYASLFYSFYSAVLSVAESVATLDLLIIATILVSSIVLSYVFIKSLPNYTGLAHGNFLGDPQNVKMLKTLVAGLSFVALSYPMAFYADFFYQLTTRPYAIYSRVSRVHVAGALGAALVIPSLYMLVVENIKKPGTRKVVAAAMAVLISITIAYGQRVQDGYKKAWEYQQWLWTSIIEQAPDMTEDTLILVETVNLPQVDYIDAHSWFGVPFALSYIFDFPPEWKNPPRMNYKEAQWASTDVRSTDGRLEIFLLRPHQKSPSPPRWEPLPDGNIMLFAALGKKLVRIDGKVITASGVEIKLKDKPGDMTRPTWPKGVLYEYLIKPDTEFDIPTPQITLRRLGKAPSLMTINSFDGARQLVEPGFDRADIKKYTIELWLRPDLDAAMRLKTLIQPYSEKYPPMPAIVGPLRLDHITRDAVLVSLMCKDDKTASHSVEGVSNSAANGEWIHIEVDVDNEARVARLFINGELVKVFEGFEAQLSGSFTLGKGFSERYWKGELADLRISSVVRHTEDFEPEMSVTSADEYTLYMLQGFE